MENTTLVRLGKYVFAGSLIMTALLVIIAIVPNWSDGINGLLGFQNSGTSFIIYPLLLFPLVSILFFLLIGFVAGLLSKSGKTEEDKQRKSKPFFFYYLCSFTLSSLLVFIISTALFNPFSRHLAAELLIEQMAVLFFIIVIISLLQAALGLSAVSMWKTNIGVSIVLLCILFVCLIATILPGAIMSSEARHSAGYYGNYTVEADEVESYDYEGDSDYYEEDHEYDSRPFCNEMWDDPDNCASNVESALNFARSRYSDYSYADGWVWKEDLRYSGSDNWLWRNETGGYEGYRNFHKMVNFVKNNPSHLARFFELYEYAIYETVSRRLYKESAAPRIVNALNIAYDDLYRDGESEGREKSLEIYSEMSGNNNWALSYFDFISERASKKSRAKFRDSDDRLDKDLFVWAYGFWGRREDEGSAQITHTMLEKIAEHYK
jgi:hypothetical protein